MGAIFDLMVKTRPWGRSSFLINLGREIKSKLRSFTLGAQKIPFPINITDSYIKERNMADPKDYIGDVKRYAEDAGLDHVKKVVNFCGIALRNRDSSLVSCSDEAERNRVRDGFCVKKLDMNTAVASAAIETVCQTMKQDRNKQRVTFYYLLANNAGTLDSH